MAQATKEAPEAAGPGHRVPPARSSDDVIASIVAIIGSLKRRSGDPEASARAFLLGHVERLSPVRATDLAEHVGLDLSTISRHLRGLEDAGLLVRSPDPDDRRASLLAATDEGRAFVDRSTRARTALLAEATASWSETDRTTLGRLLARLADDLENLS
jgi:DNA-binding MarR family transcriptional regulator